MDKKKLTTRYAAIRGQLELVIRLLEGNRSVADVMQQSMAVNGGLKKLNCRILQFHLKNHAFKGTNREEQKQDFEHLMEVIKKHQSCKS